MTDKELFEKAVGYMQEAKFDDALTTFQEVSPQAECYAETCFGKGFAHVALKHDKELALAAFQKAVENNPKLAGAQKAMAFYYSRVEPNSSLAKRYLEESQHLNATMITAEDWLELSHVYRGEKKHSEADQYFFKAIEQDALVLNSIENKRAGWTVHIHQLDVGQGDAAFIFLIDEEYPERSLRIMIDGGRKFNFESNVAFFKKHAGNDVWLDLVVAGSSDQDHCMGLPGVKGNSAAPMIKSEQTTLCSYEDTLSNSVFNSLTNYRYQQPKLGQSVWDMLGKAKPVHAPDLICVAVNGKTEYATYTSAKDAENAKSLAFVLEHGHFRFFTGGDLPSEVEDAINLHPIKPQTTTSTPQKSQAAPADPNLTVPGSVNQASSSRPNGTISREPVTPRNLENEFNTQASSSTSIKPAGSSHGANHKVEEKKIADPQSQLNQSSSSAVRAASTPGISVFKIGHHGSNGSTSRKFLENKQELAIISHGNDSRYKHPSAGAKSRVFEKCLWVYSNNHYGGANQDSIENPSKLVIAGDGDIVTSSRDHAQKTTRGHISLEVTHADALNNSWRVRYQRKPNAHWHDHKPTDKRLRSVREYRLNKPYSPAQMSELLTLIKPQFAAIHKNQQEQIELFETLKSFCKAHDLNSPVVQQQYCQFSALSDALPDYLMRIKHVKRNTDPQGLIAISVKKFGFPVNEPVTQKETQLKYRFFFPRAAGVLTRMQFDYQGSNTSTAIAATAGPRTRR